jgi:pimeloyl-[acyl-carrier protein] methyl ester esterase
MHIEKIGSGAPLLLIHGWGMHGGMWGETVEKLAQDFFVHVVDLPGHGKCICPSPLGRGSKGEGAHVQIPTLFIKSSLTQALSQGERELDAIVAQLAAQFSEPLTLCGWSLGGQIALRWAQLEPHKIQRLVLVSSTPCFVQKSGWECAMASETLAEFAAALLENHAQTLRRFLALQVRGSERERELLMSLRTALFSRGEPDLDALKIGLEILRDCDQRAALAKITQPTLIIAGERDTLTPLGASEYMAETMPNARLASIKGAAHAPFLSDTDEFVRHLKNFMNSKND